MALNYFLHRHQISVMRAASVQSPEARAAHLGLAAGYASRIARCRAEQAVRAMDESHVS